MRIMNIALANRLSSFAAIPIETTPTWPSSALNELN